MDLYPVLKFLPFKRFREPPPRVALLRLAGVIGSLGPMRHGLTLCGVKVHHLDMTHPERLAEVCNDKTRLVYFETPANPNMRLIAIRKVCAIASFCLCDMTSRGEPSSVQTV